jgi:membrane fusion protein
MTDSGGDFFRREALDAVNAPIGRPVSSGGLPSWMITALLVALLVVIAVFLVSADYTRRETVPGSLIPTAGAVNVTATSAGVVAAIYVRDGQKVHAGEKLMSISTDAVVAGGNSLADLLGGATARELTATSLQSSAQIEEGRRQQQDILAQQAGLDAEFNRMKVDLGLQGQRVTLAEQTAQASQTIYAKGFLSAITMREREEAVIAAKQALSGIQGQISTNRTQRAQLGAALALAGASQRRMRAEGDLARAGLAEKEAQVARGRSVVLTASRDGQIVGLSARLGSAVRTQQTLAVVLPPGQSLVAELWVPSRAIGFVRPGNSVRLMLDSFPYQRFGAHLGRVAYVSRVPVDPQDLPMPPNQITEPLFRVLVSIDSRSIDAYGQHWPLSPGMRLNADIVLEHRSMLEWFLDPLRAIRHRGVAS